MKNHIKHNRYLLLLQVYMIFHITVIAKREEEGDLYDFSYKSLKLAHEEQVLCEISYKTPPQPTGHRSLRGSTRQLVPAYGSPHTATYSELADSAPAYGSLHAACSIRQLRFSLWDAVRSLYNSHTQLSPTPPQPTGRRSLRGSTRHLANPHQAT